DGPSLADDALALEEGTVVAAGEEARLLALCPARGGEASCLRRGAGLALRLVAERERDPVQRARVDRREHVRLVLRGVRAARDETHPVPLDDARVMAGPEYGRSGSLCEVE